MLSLVIFLAACSSSGETDTTTPTAIVSMSCGTALADYCATNTCNQTLAGALQDSRLCPASQVQCGEFNVILKAGTNFFYSDGALVAIGRSGSPSMTCLGGPATFAAPLCASAGKSLPPCAAGDPPTGW